MGNRPDAAGEAMDQGSGSIFLTGATGALGKRIARNFLQTSDRPVVILARSKGRASSSERVRRDLATAGLDKLIGSRLKVVEGDVTKPWLGLDDATIDGLAAEVGSIYHLAASTSLHRDASECDRVNVGGTTQVLKFARRLFDGGRLDRFFHFSTAYVSGSLEASHAMEDELIAAPAHANPYEASKWAAEHLVREASAAGLPTTIFRPSIVVGDSATGEAEKFNVIYPFLKLFAHGLIASLPVRRGATINLVPVDFIARAVDVISARADSVGKTYHLVTDAPPPIEALIAVKNAEYPSMPRVELVDPSDTASRKPNGLPDRLIEPYLCYINSLLTFDTSNTRAALEDSGLTLPRIDHEFLARIGRYAVERGYLLV